MQKILIIFLGLFLLSCSQKNTDYNFDGYWLLLTQTDSGKVIIQPCDNSFSGMLIEHDTIYTEDYEEGTMVQNIYKLHKENDRYIYSNYDKKLEYRFIDTLKRIIEETEYQNGAEVRKSQYVDSANISHFKIVAQPCEECWGLEDCLKWEKQKGFQEKLEGLKNKKISQAWYGDYSLLLYEGHNVAGDYTGVGYDLAIYADSTILNGSGYQVYFKISCIPIENSDTLEIYFKKILDGNFTVDKEYLPVIKMYKKGDGFYFKSDYFGESNVEYKME